MGQEWILIQTNTLQEMEGVFRWIYHKAGLVRNEEDQLKMNMKINGKTKRCEWYTIQNHCHLIQLKITKEEEI